MIYWIFALLLSTGWSDPAEPYILSMTSVELEENVLVAWDQEQQRKVKQLELMQQFFDSETPRPEVFWRFDQGKLLDPLYVSGELVILQQELSALAIVSPLVFAVDHEPELQSRAQNSWKRLQDTRRKALESSQRFLLFIQHKLEQKSACDRALITKASRLIQLQRQQIGKQSEAGSLSLEQQQGLGQCNLAEKALQQLELGCVEWLIQVDDRSAQATVERLLQSERDSSDEPSQTASFFLQQQREIRLTLLQKLSPNEWISEQLNLHSTQQSFREIRQWKLTGEEDPTQLQQQLIRFKDLLSSSEDESIRAMLNEHIAVLASELEQRQNQENRLTELAQEQAEAERLQDEARQKKESRQSELYDVLLRVREVSSAMLTTEFSSLNKGQQWLGNIEKQQLELRQRIQECMSLPISDPKRPGEFTKLHSEWHAQVRALQTQSHKVQEQLTTVLGQIDQELIEFNRLLSEFRLATELQEDLVELESAIADLDKNEKVLKKELSGQLSQIFDFLKQAKLERRDLRVIRDEAALEQVDFWKELQSEVREIPWLIGHAIEQIRALRVLDFLSIAYLQRSFRELLVLSLFLGFWVLIRQNVNDISSWTLKSLRYHRLNFGNANLRILRQHLRRSDKLPFLDELVDIFALLLLNLVVEHTVLSLLLSLLTFALLYRLIKILFAWWYEAFETTTESQSQHNQLKQGLIVLLIWSFGFGLLRESVLTFLWADRFEELLAGLQYLALMLLIFAQLQLWNRSVCALVAQREDFQRLQQYMSSMSTGFLRRRVQTVLGLLILILRFFFELASLLIEGSSWLGFAIARQSVHSSTLNLPPLTEDIVERFNDQREDDNIFSDELKQIQASIARWHESKSIGLGALIGGYGSGSPHLIRCLSQLQLDAPFRLVRFSERTLNPALVFQQLGTQLTQHPWEGSEQSISGLLSQPPSIICVDDAHLLMLRNVDGYHALRAFLDVIQHTAHHHFWLVSFHRPAWSFLMARATPVNLSIFNHVIDIKPLKQMMLASWLLERTEAMNLRLSFDSLSAYSSDVPRWRRAISAYWRIIVDISSGNPSVAEAYWLSSLKLASPDFPLRAKCHFETPAFYLDQLARLEPFYDEAEEKDSVVQSNVTEITPPKVHDALVTMFSLPDEDVLQSLQDDELFVLLYLYIHEHLTLSELVSALSMSNEELLRMCNHLRALNLINKSEEHYIIDHLWWPIIGRYLEQKRLMISSNGEG